MGCGQPMSVSVRDEGVALDQTTAGTTPVWVGGMDWGRMQAALTQGTWAPGIITLEVSLGEPVENQWVAHPASITLSAAGMTGAVDFRGILWARARPSAASPAGALADVTISASKGVV